jgi:hypothetical protein
MTDELESIRKVTAVVYSRYYPRICMEGLSSPKLTQKIELIIADIPAEIRTEHLQNTNQRDYRQVDISDWLVWFIPVTPNWSIGHS